MAGKGILLETAGMNAFIEHDKKRRRGHTIHLDTRVTPFMNEPLLENISEIIDMSNSFVIVFCLLKFVSKRPFASKVKLNKNRFD